MQYVQEEATRKKVEGIKKIEEYMRHDLKEFPKLLETKLQICLEDYTREENWENFFNWVG